MLLCRFISVSNQDNVVFIAGDEEEQILANKRPLLWGSRVFERMFDTSNGYMFNRELINFHGQQLPVFKIPDVYASSLKNIIQFLYKEPVSLSVDNVFNTLYAARKYDIIGIEETICNFITSHMSVDNAFIWLSSIRFFSFKNLESLCWSTLERQASKAVRSSIFLEIDHDFLCDFLRRFKLRIQELELFMQVILWAKEECRRQMISESKNNIRKVLGKALYLIRFPAMSIKEFRLAAKKNILNKPETDSILRYIETKKEIPRLFLCRRRQPEVVRHGAIVLSENEIYAKRFMLEYYCGSDYYKRPFADPNSNQPIRDYSFCWKAGNVQGEIEWTIDLNGMFIKSIKIDLGRFFTRNNGRIEANFTYRFSTKYGFSTTNYQQQISQQITNNNPIIFKESNSIGELLRINVKFFGDRNDCLDAQLFRTHAYDMKRNMLIDLEFY